MKDREMLLASLDITEESDKAVLVKIADLEIDGQQFPVSIWLPKSQVQISGGQVTGISQFMFESMLGKFRPCKIGEEG